jgi:tRNA A-37 threonylcarbamoyl transferase component Bud32
MPLNSGDVFAGYTIDRLLGTGGMGEVYLAQHPRLPRHDALKILTRDSAVDGEFRARFVREAELAATLRHPHIVGVLDRGEFDGRLWISMDYVDGTDAGRLIRESYPGGMPEPDVFEIVTAVADALDFGHERRLLHRDVKPENILVTESDGRRRSVLLTDFGIARRIDDVSNLTDDNVAVGTVSYMAPEQLLSRPLDGRSDQYALAATAFHLLTGAPPFQDPNRAVVISHHLSTPPPRISDRRPDLAHLDAVLARALAKDADERYPSCLDFARALTAQRPRRDSVPNPTQRLERVTVHGAARGVTQRAGGTEGQPGVLSLHVLQFDPIVNGRNPIAVEIQTQLLGVALVDGDEVEVSGVWDGDTLDAEEIRIFSADAPPKRQSSPNPGRRRIAAFAALAAVIVLAAAATVWFTDGFGAWTRQGPIVKPQSATVFSPGGAADNPDKASLAIDGNPDTSWPTVTYTDAVPFPNFIEGEGLMLHLSEPTALSAVTIDLSSTGTEVQIRSSPTENPTALDDTTELVGNTPLQPGHNRIEVDDPTETSNVLVWISKLGTTDGRSRTEISEITVQAAP